MIRMPFEDFLFVAPHENGPFVRRQILGGDALDIVLGHRGDLGRGEVDLGMVQQELPAPVGERLEAELGSAPVGAGFREPFFKRLERAVFADVFFDLVSDQGRVRFDERADFVPRDPLLGDRFEVMPVPRLQVRHLKEPVHERAIWVVGVVKRLEPWTAQPGRHAGAAGDVHHLVAVVL